MRFGFSWILLLFLATARVPVQFLYGSRCAAIHHQVLTASVQTAHRVMAGSPKKHVVKWLLAPHLRHWTPFFSQEEGEALLDGPSSQKSSGTLWDVASQYWPLVPKNGGIHLTQLCSCFVLSMWLFWKNCHACSCSSSYPKITLQCRWVLLDPRSEWEKVIKADSTAVR